MKILFCMMAALWALLLAGCGGVTGGGDGTEKPGDGKSEKNVDLTFFNESSYRVTLYKDLNPTDYDPSAVYLTVSAGQSASVKEYPSSDALTGNGFYPRYQVLLADSITTGTADIYIPAERNLADIDHISFVLESGKSYTKTVRQPDTLVFINAYLKLYNSGSQSVQLRNASTPLKRLDASEGNEGYYVQPGKTGYFELEIPYYSENKSFDMLRIYDNSAVSLPEFTAEKGKLYSYTWDGGSATSSAWENIAY